MNEYRDYRQNLADELRQIRSGEGSDGRTEAQNKLQAEQSGDDYQQAEKLHKHDAEIERNPELKVSREIERFFEQAIQICEGLKNEDFSKESQRLYNLWDTEAVRMGKNYGQRLLQNKPFQGIGTLFSAVEYLLNKFRARQIKDITAQKLGGRELLTFADSTVVTRSKFIGDFNNPDKVNLLLSVAQTIDQERTAVLLDYIRRGTEGRAK